MLDLEVNDWTLYMYPINIEFQAKRSMKVTPKHTKNENMHPENTAQNNLK